MVYKLEKKDKEAEKEQEEVVRKSEQAEKRKREDARLKEERERENRRVRREKNQDYYRAAIAALETFEEVFEAAQSRPLTTSDMVSMELDEAMAQVYKISDRVPALNVALSDVWVNGSALERHAFPEADLFSGFFIGQNPETQDKRGHKFWMLIREASVNAAQQVQISVKGQLKVKEARSAVEREWGA
ncbi:hypothetical protein [Saccharothrix texasensis]|nr:hypothetical protein [Saccharothrix texasensis]